MDNLLASIIAVPAFAATISIVVEEAKKKGWIKLGQAGRVAGFLNIGAWLVVLVLRSLGIEDEIQPLIALANEAMPIVFLLLAGMGGTALTHNLFNRTGFFPKSPAPRPVA
ncbi:hypothetical protein LCGC14_2172030 [marine sediment metagenome]|uniref:Uncharacterized protein n=1 Tax=marine sediment metagenome TaxID=412755 RepID=A0A0F9EC19_9ZZZZ